MFSWHCCITDTLKLITETNNYIKNKLDEPVDFTSLVYGYSSEQLLLLLLHRHTEPCRFSQ